MILSIISVGVCSGYFPTSIIGYEGIADNICSPGNRKKSSLT
jgi:hypothetical protein